MIAKLTAERRAELRIEQLTAERNTVQARALTLARQVDELTAERDALAARVAELEAMSLTHGWAQCIKLAERIHELEAPPVVPEGWEVNRIDYEVDHDEYESRWELWALDSDHVSFMVAYADSFGEVNSPGGSASTTALGALFYAHRTNQRPPHVGEAAR